MSAMRYFEGAMWSQFTGQHPSTVSAQRQEKEEQLMDLVNSVVVIAFNVAVLALLVWLMGSIALRFVGWAWIAFGVVIVLHGASTGEATPGTYALGAFNVALGTTFWFCGHVLYALRHGQWKSAVAATAVKTLRRPFTGQES